jgi:hypothetical protein
MDNFQKYISISRQARRITLQRYLLSKLVLETWRFTASDLYALFLNQLWLEQKCARDSGFLQKFGRTLEVLSSLMKEINFRTDFTDRALRRFGTRVRNNLAELLIPKRNFRQVDRRYCGFVQPIDPTLRSLERRSKKLQKRRIGIGYRDKGTLKNLAVDGSPSWQEVATHHGQLKEVPHEKKKSTKSFNGPIRYIRIKGSPDS